MEPYIEQQVGNWLSAGYVGARGGPSSKCGVQHRLRPAYEDLGGLVLPGRKGIGPTPKTQSKLFCHQYLRYVECRFRLLSVSCKGKTEFGQRAASRGLLCLGKSIDPSTASIIRAKARPAALAWVLRSPTPAVRFARWKHRRNQSVRWWSGCADALSRRLALDERGSRTFLRRDACQAHHL